LQWLQVNAKRRSFLFLHFDDPHQPFCQPEPYIDAFGTVTNKIEMPLSLSNGANQSELAEVASSLYDGAIAYVDDRIGTFIDALKRRNLYDDSVIVFVSDHGEELWEYGNFGHRNGSVYDVSIRVPMIIKPVKGSFPSGQVVPTQVSAFDLMPTLLELAGIPLTSDIDARSLVPLLAAQSGQTADRVAVAETKDTNFAVRTRRWKYILRTSRHHLSVETLFDHAADPQELENVAADHPKVLERLRVQLFDYLMLHRSGRYLVALDFTSASPDQYVIRGAELSDPICFGVLPTTDEAGNLRFEASAEAPLVFVASVSANGPVEVGPERAAREFARYTSGDLDSLLAERASGLFLFTGPSPVLEEENPTQAMDLEQLEALRALGYVGENE